MLSGPSLVMQLKRVTKHINSYLSDKEDSAAARNVQPVRSTCIPSIALDQCGTNLACCVAEGVQGPPEMLLERAQAHQTLLRHTCGFQPQGCRTVSGILAETSEFHTTHRTCDDSFLRNKYDVSHRMPARLLRGHRPLQPL